MIAFMSDDERLVKMCADHPEEFHELVVKQHQHSHKMALETTFFAFGHLDDADDQIVVAQSLHLLLMGYGMLSSCYAIAGVEDKERARLIKKQIPQLMKFVADMQLKEKNGED